MTHASASASASDSKGHQHHTHTGRPGHGPAPEHDTDLAQFLDLDAALGAPVMARALAVASGSLGDSPRSIVDLGAGTGTGTFALASRFPDARIHSIDASPGMLERIHAAAAATGAAGRVETHLLDLDGDWPAALPGNVDLAWAALSLHHVTDPVHMLGQVFELLRPGGVLIVTEMTGATTYDPSDLGTSNNDLGERLVGALAALGYPVTADWTTALTAAGFSPVTRHDTELTASSRTPDGARYLALQLTLNRAILSDELSAADLTALNSATAALVAGTSEVDYTSGRVVWAAVKPGAVASTS